MLTAVLATGGDRREVDLKLSTVAALRWGTAGLILAALILASAISSGGANLLVCPDGPGEPCRPLELTDLPVVSTLTLVLLLLMPDLSRISIAGIIELQKSVNEVKEEATATRDEVAGLRQELTATFTAGASSGAAVHHQSTINLLHPGAAASIDQRELENRAAEAEDA